MVVKKHLKDKEFGIITNKKTGLFKKVMSVRYTEEQWDKIIKFYIDHEDYTFEHVDQYGNRIIK